MAAQPEILDYANHIAERFDLRSDIEFSTRVTSAHFRDDEQRWHVTTDSGKEYAARFCVMATGCLSVPNTPQINGVDNFAGDVFHTGNWPAEGVDFTRRVGIIGTGSSAIQAIPVIAEQAEHLTVFQRTPNYTMPAHNRRSVTNVNRLLRTTTKLDNSSASPKSASLTLISFCGADNVEPTEEIL